MPHPPRGARRDVGVSLSCAYLTVIYGLAMSANKDSRSREEILKDTLAEGMRIQHQFRPEPLYKTTGRGSYKSNTVAEIAAAKKKSAGKG